MDFCLSVPGSSPRSHFSFCSVQAVSLFSQGVGLYLKIGGKEWWLPLFVCSLVFVFQTLWPVRPRSSSRPGSWWWWRCRSGWSGGSPERKSCSSSWQPFSSSQQVNQKWCRNIFTKRIFLKDKFQMSSFQHKNISDRFLTDTFQLIPSENTILRRCSF